MWKLPRRRRKQSHIEVPVCHPSSVRATIIAPLSPCTAVNCISPTPSPDNNDNRLDEHASNSQTLKSQLWRAECFSLLLIAVVWFFFKVRTSFGYPFQSVEGVNKSRGIKSKVSNTAGHKKGGALDVDSAAFWLPLRTIFESLGGRRAMISFNDKKEILCHVDTNGEKVLTFEKAKASLVKAYWGATWSVTLICHRFLVVGGFSSVAKKTWWPEKIPRSLLGENREENRQETGKGGCDDGICLCAQTQKIVNSRFNKLSDLAHLLWNLYLKSSAATTSRSRMYLALASSPDSRNFIWGNICLESQKNRGGIVVYWGGKSSCCSVWLTDFVRLIGKL